MDYSKQVLMNRWRLILGNFSNDSLCATGMLDMDVQLDSGGTYRMIDDLLDFLYDREYGEERGMREGGSGSSVLAIPQWIEQIRTLFPTETVERLENHALERYQLTELLTDPEVLEKLEPNMQLLKSILSMKSLMKGDVLNTAKRIVRTVVEEIKRKMETEIRNGVMGRINRNSAAPYKCSQNFDFKRTIAKNLKNYDAETGQIVVEHIYFNRNIQRYNPWHIIICVDESGSMVDSVIYSAIMAGIFSSLPVLSVKLVIFDTSIVDLSEYVADPVETLMSVQLGGGTDIGMALTYCEQLLVTPSRSIVVLVSDLCDGGGYQTMYARTKSIVEAGAKLFVLTALDPLSQSYYDKHAAEKMSRLGADIAAVTPGMLAGWIGEVIK